MVSRPPDKIMISKNIICHIYSLIKFNVPKIANRIPCNETEVPWSLRQIVAGFNPITYEFSCSLSPGSRSVHD